MCLSADGLKKKGIDGEEGSEREWKV